MMTYFELPKKQTSVFFNQNTIVFFHENAFENIVFNMTAILFKPPRINSCRYIILEAGAGQRLSVYVPAA